MSTAEEGVVKRVGSPSTVRSRGDRLWPGYSNGSLSPSNVHNDSSSEPARPESRNSERRDPEKGHREYPGAGELRNLDEIAAPPPIDEEAQRRQSHLEDQPEGRTPGIESIGTGSFPSRPDLSRTATEIYTISYLIVFSILGTLARLGLQALTFYPGAPVQTGLLWANVGGSFTLGFLLEDRMLFCEEWGAPRASDALHGSKRRRKNITLAHTSSKHAQHTATKKTLPLYIGLATGFCGSFTSFSAFIRDAFFALANALPVPINHPSLSNPPSPISQDINVPRNGGYSFLATLAVLVSNVGLSIGALQMGAHLALGLERWTPSLPFTFFRKIIDRVFVVLAVGMWVGAIVMAVLPPDRSGGPLEGKAGTQESWRGKALFALAFAPLGCLLRFYASLLLNGKIKSFPLGTFAVNIFGSAIGAMYLDLQHGPVGGLVGCQVLQGVDDGFCGCLTTVSTWVAEIKALRTRHAYVYAIVSMGVALSAFVIITGSLLWTQGFKPLKCVV